MTSPTEIRTTKGRGRLFDSVLDTVGDTPAIRINNLGVEGRTIYVKAEFFNPASSVKDRLALGIIEDAERRGLLKPASALPSSAPRRATRWSSPWPKAFPSSGAS
jgi:cysteine synthase A